MNKREELLTHIADQKRRFMTVILSHEQADLLVELATGPSMKHFKPEKRKHWPIIQSYRDKKLSRAQAEAQLKDLGLVGWEITLYLDNDQECEDGQ